MDEFLERSNKMTDKIIETVLFVLLILVVGWLLMIMVNRIMVHRKKINKFTLLMCKILGWHYVVDYDSKTYGTCAICGKDKLLQDSQGNWFE
jgi:hypothetical protein